MAFGSNCIMCGGSAAGSTVSTLPAQVQSVSDLYCKYLAFHGNSMCKLKVPISILILTEFMYLFRTQSFCPFIHHEL